jgi:hypothetical protein
MTATLKTALTFCFDPAVTRIITARQEKPFETLARWAALCAAGLRNVAPYAAIEIILPGGSLMALILWLYRRRKARAAPRRQANMPVAFSSVGR